MDRQKLRKQYEREIKRIVTRLRRTYDPEKVVLFESCARGDFGEDADIDLLIIRETSLRALDRMREVYEVVYSPRHYLALDPFVFAPAELSRKLEARDSLIHEIVREVLYERA